MLAAGCGQVWNDPYPAAEQGRNILYTAFTQRPKHLDPVQSYSEDEATFLYQIYEPPLQYHYLKRPFQLIAAAAETMPRLRQFDAAGRPLPPGADPASIARSEYEIRIRPGIADVVCHAGGEDDRFLGHKGHALTQGEGIDGRGGNTINQQLSGFRVVKP